MLNQHYTESAISFSLDYFQAFAIPNIHASIVPIDSNANSNGKHVQFVIVRWKDYLTATSCKYEGAVGGFK